MRANIEQVVYDVAEAFGSIGTVMSPRRIYTRMGTDRPYFPVLRDQILPDLAKRGMLEQTDSGSYKFLGVSAMAEVK